MMILLAGGTPVAFANQPSIGDLLSPFPEKVDFEGSASAVALDAV